MKKYALIAVASISIANSQINPFIYKPEYRQNPPPIVEMVLRDLFDLRTPVINNSCQITWRKSSDNRFMIHSNLKIEIFADEKNYKQVLAKAIVQYIKQFYSLNNFPSINPYFFAKLEKVLENELNNDIFEYKGAIANPNIEKLNQIVKQSLRKVTLP
jgi:hypothetical protein